MGICYAKQPPTLDECVEYIPTTGFVVSVYDGDTFTLAVWNNEIKKWTKWPVRVARIDCPELRTKNLNEKQIALKAKTFVEERILHKRVELKNVAREKYGRILADVFVSGQTKSINDLLIEQRLAVSYDGGTKHVPDDWVVWHNNLL
jgi:endonuclease YncB( thermonuclease family)